MEYPTASGRSRISSRIRSGYGSSRSTSWPRSWLVYLVILTAYFGKVILTASWPSGWIGWLVSSVAVTGILSLLLLDPVRRNGGHAWARGYARWFYVALFPSIIMLLMAIWQRVAQYGITEPRYFLVILTLWLGSIAVYATAANRSTVKVIPLTLAALAFTTSFGPWGAYQVSRRSQTERLRGVLEQTGALVDGTVRAVTADIPTENAQQISAGFRYLLEKHGAASIVSWFPEQSGRHVSARQPAPAGGPGVR